MIASFLYTFMKKGKVGKLCLIKIFIIISSVVLMLSNLTSVCFASGSTAESRSGLEIEHEIAHNHAAVFVGGMSPVGESNETIFCARLKL